MNYSLFLLISIAVSVSLVKSQSVSVASFNGGQAEIFSVSNIDVPNSAATGRFSNEVNKTGWAFLEIKTSPSFSDYIQAYAAGLLEGTLSKPLIDAHWINTMEDYCPVPLTPYCNRLLKFLRINIDWMNEQIENNPNDPFWHQVALMLVQINGISDGFHGKTGKPRTTIENPFGLYLFEIDGDREELEPFLKKPDITRVTGHGSCSALVKLLPGYKELFVSHDTWSTYQSMLRVTKKYIFSYRMTNDPKSARIPGHSMSFSSYPGTIVSGDDFYVVETGLVSQETTNGLNDHSLYKYIKPKSVLENFRSMVANRLANSGSEWKDVFKRYNSGTYNNQWMIVDYKHFKPGQPPMSGLLYVLEQIPSHVTGKDVSKVLVDQGYWPSFNIPYFKDIYNMSGYPAMVAKFGDWFTHDKGPRANIFRRDHKKVIDMDSMLVLMRYNDFKHDPYSKCNCTPPYSGENGIMARCDLNPTNGTYPFGALGHREHGGTDTKVTSFEMSSHLEFIGVSGPTADQQPPFKWSTSGFKDTPHKGHPDAWNFKPVQHKWVL